MVTTLHSIDQNQAFPNLIRATLNHGMTDMKGIYSLPLISSKGLGKWFGI